MGTGDPGRARGRPRRQPGRRPVDGLVQDAQGPRLPASTTTSRTARRTRMNRERSGSTAQSVHGRGTASSTRASTSPRRPTPRSARHRPRRNFEIAISVLRDDDAAVDCAQRPSAGARRLGAGATCEGFHAGRTRRRIFDDPRSTTSDNYPASMWTQPGDKAPNRAALATWGAWVNASARAEYDRPLFLACSADLAESTNISGFAKDFDGQSRAGAGTTATRTRAARCCRRRSPSSRTPASASASPPSTWPTTRSARSTASGPPARPTGRSPTSSTGRCGCSASWPRTAISRSAR